MSSVMEPRPTAADTVAVFQNLIGGKWRAASDGRTVAMLSPSDGKAFASIARGTKADVDAAVPVVVNAIVQNGGQTCSAGSRVLVQKSIYDVFVAQVIERFRQLRVGSHAMDLDCGPLISANQSKRLRGFIDRASKARPSYSSTDDGPKPKSHHEGTKSTNSTPSLQLSPTKGRESFKSPRFQSPSPLAGEGWGEGACLRSESLKEGFPCT